MGTFLINSEVKKMQYQLRNNKEWLLYILDKNNIEYVLLSEYLDLKTNGDLDLYIPIKYKNQLEDLFKKYNIYKMKHIPAYKNHYYYYGYIQNKTLRIDIKYEMSFYDKDFNVYRIYNNENSIISNRIEIKKNIMAPNYFEAIILYLSKIAFYEKSAISKENIKNAILYIDSFRKKLNSEEQQIIDKLNTILLTKIKTEENKEKITKELRKRLRIYFEITKKGISLKDKLLRKIKLFGQPKFAILFLGADGAGKSTIIKALEQYLDIPYKELYGGVGEKGWSNFLTLWFYKKITNSYILKKTQIARLLMYNIFSLEILLRRLPTINNGKNILLFIDRAPPLIKSRAKIVSNLFYYLFHKPNLVIKLTAPIDVLCNRKPKELTKEIALQKTKEDDKLFLFYKNKHISSYEINTFSNNLLQTEKYIESILWKDNNLKKALFYV